jgi:hypothetical protein
MRSRIRLCLVFTVLLPFYSFHPPGQDIERYITITLLSTHPISNNGVGDQWDNFLSVGDKIIKKGEKLKVKLENRAPLTVEAQAIEHDDEYSDQGKNSMIFTYSDLIAIKKAKFKITVKVMENGGPNQGNMAEWLYLFEIVGEEK